MIAEFFVPNASPAFPKEGELYKILSIFGKTFEIRYGYYEEFERMYHEPMAIYPDFLSNPEYTDSGQPLVTAMQDVCEYYRGKPDGDTCADCRYFQKCEDLIGLCSCSHKAICADR